MASIYQSTVFLFFLQMMLNILVASTPVSFGAYLCNLLKAEELYIKDVFPEGLPRANKSGLSEPPEGIIILSRNNTEKIQDSICAINDYLKNHLPAIIKCVAVNDNKILHNTEIFLDGFKQDPKVSHIWKKINETECQRVPTSPAYEMKRIGYRIIHFARRCVEGVINKTCIHP